MTMASWTLHAALCLIACLTFMGYAEGLASCNNAEIEGCKNAAAGFKECRKNDVYNCNPLCIYTNSQSTVCSPPGQRCSMDQGSTFGECDGKCTCYVRT